MSVAFLWLEERLGPPKSTIVAFETGRECTTGPEFTIRWSCGGRATGPNFPSLKLGSAACRVVDAWAVESVEPSTVSKGAEPDTSEPERAGSGSPRSVWPAS